MSESARSRRSLPYRNALLQSLRPLYSPYRIISCPKKIGKQFCGLPTIFFAQPRAVTNGRRSDSSVSGRSECRSRGCREQVRRSAKNRLDDSRRRSSAHDPKPSFVAAAEPVETPVASESPIAQAGAIEEKVKTEKTKVDTDHFAISPTDKNFEPLKVILLDETELRGGQSVTLRVLVSRSAGERRAPAGKARIVVKTLGTNFRPTSTLATTNAQGIASIPVLLPSFEGGRAAVLVQAHIDGETAELRRIILPTESS